MTYATGSLSTATQLINTLESFANANGWTTNLSAALGGNRRLHLQKSNCFANFSTNEGTLISMNGSSGFNGASLWNAQPAPLSGTTSCPLTGVVGGLILPCTYHLFAQSSPDFIAAVFVSANQAVTYLVFGQMEKIGSYAGGEFYCAGDFFNSATGSPGTALPIQAFLGTNAAKNATAFYTVNSYCYTAGVDSRTGMAVLMPIRAFEVVGAALKPRGVFPWVRVASRGYNNGTEIVFGADHWMIFYSSYNLGATMVAFLK